MDLILLHITLGIHLRYDSHSIILVVDEANNFLETIGHL